MEAPRRSRRTTRDGAGDRSTVAMIGSVVEREQIDCDWHHGGSLTVARNRASSNACGRRPQPSGSGLAKTRRWQFLGRGELEHG